MLFILNKENTLTKKYVKEDLIKHIENGRTLKQIAALYEVSSQRIYQVFHALGITTLERYKKSHNREMDDKTKWAWKIIGTRIPRSRRTAKMDLLETMNLVDTCPILGIPLDYSFGKGVRTENSPSIDQIIPGAGYIPGNVIVISWRANRIKNDGSPEEHLKIYEFYSKLTK
jgi:hypothetical protein